ncbi:MAG: Gfo/Idh/MocA family oxidoreductase [Deltaproteobacteria bacterium]|nr:Gfo/Idh/MocA family oxidoreductase [Deltaproteobacteria bacterium]
MNQQKSSSPPLRVGVIGVGYLGQHHARIYSEMDGVELVGIADTDRERMKEITDRFSVPAHDDYRTLVPKIDAVNIVSPTVTHHKIARECLEAGLDVFVEKPITVTPDEASDLVRLAEAKKKILQVGHIERFNGAVRELARLVKDPGFIEVHRLGSFVGRATDVDVVLDLMIHDIDIILSLIQSPVREIRANGVPVITPNVDIANARLEFQNGCVANVTASRVSTHPQRKMRFFQPDAYISLDFQEQELEYYRRIGDPAEFLAGKPPRIVKEEVTIPREEPLKVELSSFIEVLHNRSRPVVSGKEGLHALLVATNILQEIQSHPPDTTAFPR